MKHYDFLIIHGTDSSPGRNWFPWLYNILDDEYDRRVLMPHFPVYDGRQTYENWEKVLKVYDPWIGEGTSIIAHSIAPAFVANYLLNHRKKVRSLYFVCGFYDLLGDKKLHPAISSFLTPRRDLEDLKILAPKQRVMIYTDNDPYVPQHLSEHFADRIAAQRILIPGGEHLNQLAGYRELPELFEAIKADL